MIKHSRFLYLVFLLPFLLLASCDKNTVEPGLDDLDLTLTAEIMPDGDVEFTYTELNDSEQDIHFARTTSCPIFEVKLYENGTLVDNLYNNYVCTDDIPAFTLEPGESNSYTGDWLHNPSRSPLPSGSYLARLIVTLGSVGADHDQTDIEYRNFTVVGTFVID